MEEEKQQHIDQYLLGQMKEAKRGQFEKELADDPLLQKDLELQKEIIQGVEEFHNRQLKNRIKTIHQKVVVEENSPKVKKMNPWFKYAAIAATVLLLIVAGIGLYFSSSPATSNELYQAYFEPYPLTTTPRDVNIDQGTPGLSTLYLNKQYSILLPRLQKLASANPNDQELQLGLGICYLELEQTAEAIAIFQGVVQSNDPLYIDQGRWYLALAFLKSDQIDGAKASLQPLANDPSADHHEDARKLLRRIK